jgi:hypothetical protein
MLCLGLFAVGCGGDDGATQEQLEAARAEGAKEAEQEAKVEQLEKQIEQLKKNQAGNSGKSSGGSQGGSGASGSGGPVASCGDGVRVGPDTSCQFAMNVAGEKGSNPDASVIDAYSPVTGEHYTMTCGPWNGGGTVCTGGNGATVYLP